MHIEKTQPWFGARRYGSGWAPRGWQGWGVMALYLALSVGGTTFLAQHDEATGALIYALILTSTLIVACAGMGDPPRWRWGGR